MCYVREHNKMQSYKFGDVVYAATRYADDATYADNRPAVVISSQILNRERKDVVLMEITTRLHQAKHFGAFIVTDWKASGLREPSVIKPLIFTVSKSEIIETCSVTDKSLRATLLKIFGFRPAASPAPGQSS